jgi:hypothetical protein
MTPEKARLMKAMKLREKKKQLSQQPPSKPVPTVEVSPDVEEADPPAGNDEEAAEKASQVYNYIGSVEKDGDADSRLSMSNADSAIAIDVVNDQASMDTRIDSHPDSPIAESSEIGDSTQASSLSESTDETVQPGHEEKRDTPNEEVDTDVKDDLENGIGYTAVDPVVELRPDPESIFAEPQEETVQVLATSPLTSIPEVPEGQTELEPDAPHMTSADPVPETPTVTIPETEDIVVEVAPTDAQEHSQEETSEEPAEEHQQETSEAQAEQRSEETPEQAPVVALSQALAQEPVNFEDTQQAKVSDAEKDATEDDGEVAGTSKTELSGKEISSSQSPVLPISKFAATTQCKTEVLDKTSLSQHATRVDAGLPENKNLQPEAQELPQVKVPLSKFSTRDGRFSSTLIAAPVQVSITSPPEVASSSKGKEAEQDGANDARQKRRAAIEPILTDHRLPDKENAQADSNLSDDDELMEELQSATLHQAKPVTVSKSPLTPTMPGMLLKKSSTTALESGSTTPRVVRTISNPIRGTLLTPPDVSESSARAVSSGAAFLHKLTQQSSAADLRPKTGKLGSGISQRIKALEMLSESQAAAAEPPAKERPASTFFSVRKNSIREPTRSPSIAERANSISRAVTPSPRQSRESSPETGRIPIRDRSGSMRNRLSVFEGGNLPRGRPESIQVTARIVRDPAQPFPKVPDMKADVADFGPLDLKNSPLVVDHQQAASEEVVLPPTDAPAESDGILPRPVENRLSIIQRRFSRGSRSQSQDRALEDSQTEAQDESDAPVASRRRSSLTIVKDFIKERRDSLLGSKSPSTDNLNLGVLPSPKNFTSPTMPTSARSTSRPPSVHQNSSIFPRRLSISSRRSSVDQKSPVLPAGGSSTSVLSPATTTEASLESDGDDKTKGGSRASRLFRRLSNSLSTSRKTGQASISPTVTEEHDAEVAAADASKLSAAGYTGPAIIAYMGDVNVQFPDSLLWKRRTICLDSQGFLILSAVQGLTAANSASDKHHQAGAIKRYHLSEFRPPYVPEMEIQELPNSIVLDFVEGSGIQLACEDRAGQRNMLKCNTSPSSPLLFGSRATETNCLIQQSSRMHIGIILRLGNEL